MKITLIRGQEVGNATPGLLYLDGKPECATLEDISRDIKVKGETCIQKGSYKVTITMSDRFKKLMPILANVPNFKGIRIHSGNTSADTEGCILVGTTAGTLNGNATISGSIVAFDRLMKKLQASTTPIVMEIK